MNPMMESRGKGFWRLRVSLLDREDYRLALSQFLNSRLDSTAHMNPDIRWEYIKLGIREFSIKFNNDLKSRSTQLERQLEERLKVLENEMYSSDEKTQEFHDCKRELLEIQLLASREAMVRS